MLVSMCHVLLGLVLCSFVQKSATRDVTAAAAVDMAHLDLGFDLIWLRCFS